MSEDNGFKEHKLLILDALKRHEERINKIEKMLWGAIIGIVTILMELVVSSVVGRL